MTSKREKALIEENKRLRKELRSLYASCGKVFWEWYDLNEKLEKIQKVLKDV